MGFLEPCVGCPLHLHLWMSSLKFGDYMILMGVFRNCSWFGGKLDRLKGLRGTFEALVGSLNTVVATDWRWVMFGRVYRWMWETFVNDLRIGLVYHVVAEVVEGARNRVRFPLIIFDVACSSHLCLWVALHFTTLVSYVSWRTGRTSISTSNYQHVRSVRRLVAYLISIEIFFLFLT